MLVLGQLKKAQLENLSGDPATPSRGYIYFNTTTGKARVYDGASWADVGSGGGGALIILGTRAAPELITAAGGITSTSAQRQLHFVAGNAAPITVTANPQISAGATVGQEIVVEGRDSINTVTLSDGTGLDLNGPCALAAGSTIGLVWDGTNWVEMWRR